MSQARIYEVFGYPITDQSQEASIHRKSAICPFTSMRCDGGGNRYMSEINLKEHAHRDLAKLFPGQTKLPAGVCSIQLKPDESPWIICPRRLLYMGRNADESILHATPQKKLLSVCRYPKGTTLGIWSELSVSYTDTTEEKFDYRLDYVLMPVTSVSQDDAAEAANMDWKPLRKMLLKSGFAFAQRDGIEYVEQFPVGRPSIIEIMTSSTSGGNKANRSQIPQAMEDFMLGKAHVAPSINYRQVWARMASQLIVKSQAALAWGGKTIWVVQDLLADYISRSTALDLQYFLAKRTNEVNILAFSYGKSYRHPKPSEPIYLKESKLYSGPIKAAGDLSEPSFQDIILASVCPPKYVLIQAMCKKGLCNLMEL